MNGASLRERLFTTAIWKQCLFGRRLIRVNSPTVKGLEVVGGILCGLVVALSVWIAVRWNAPPLTVVRDGSKVTVDVSTLGEYPTTVTRIRLSDVGNGAVVWEVRSENGAAQLHGFSIAEGDNPVQVDAYYGSYRVLVPSNSASFALHRGMHYKIELWGGASVLTRKSAVFSVGDSR
jgi:hypothetical protein